MGTMVLVYSCVLWAGALEAMHEWSASRKNFDTTWQLLFFMLATFTFALFFSLDLVPRFDVNPLNSPLIWSHALI